MDKKKPSYQIMKNITKNPNEDVSVCRENMFIFNTTGKAVSEQNRNLDAVYGQPQNPYKYIYGRFL
jgi:hypothetical protein